VVPRALAVPIPCRPDLLTNRNSLGRRARELVRSRPARQGEEAMSRQVGARGHNCDQHQLLECLRCNFIPHMLSEVHAEHDRQHRKPRRLKRQAN
jgi:hypothetical protein